MSAVIDVPVLIVGGGPVGVTLAMDLASRGIKSVVLEKRRDIPPNPRCNTTNARSMEIFRRLGCADEIRRTGLPPEQNTDIIYMTEMNGDPLCRFRRPTRAEFAAGTPVGIGADWPTPEPQQFLSQMYLEPVLREHAKTHYNVDLREGWELLSFVQDDQGVTAKARDVETGEEAVFRAAYLVGSDGSNSIVRRDIGARLEGIPSLGNNCSTMVRAPRLKEIYAEQPAWMYRFIGGTVLVAIDGEDLWLFHVNLRPDLDLATFDPEPAMFKAVGESFDYEVVSQARWSPRAMVATKYRDRRVFLAGDAAHIWVPLGGFGMNAGVGDAISIGWMLAGVLQGWLDPKILDAYEAERAPLGTKVAAQAARWNMELFPLIGIGAEPPDFRAGGAAARQALGAKIREVNIGEFNCPGMQLGYYYTDSPIIAHDGTDPPPFLLQTYTETSWPGVRAPHLWRDGGASLFDQFGPGFTLLRIGTTPPSGQGLIDAVTARQIPLTVLDVPEAAAVEKYQGYGLVLVRPDQHIAWRSKNDPADVGAVIDRVTGALVPESVVADLQAARIDGDFAGGGGLHVRNGQPVEPPVPAIPNQSADRGWTPNAIGSLPDGRLVIAVASERKLYVEQNGGLRDYADLRQVARGDLGDIVVDRTGRVYVSDLGDSDGRIIAVDMDHSARMVLANLGRIHGMALTPDGTHLILSDADANRLVQSRVKPDGGLNPPKPFVTLAEPCQGLSINPDGSLWLCLPGSRSVARYDAAGRQTARVQLPNGSPRATAHADDGVPAQYVYCVDPDASGHSVPGWLMYVVL